jgi:glycosyltransferase involved in cell wall biosynthesis
MKADTMPASYSQYLPKLLLAMPLPPPYSGLEMSTEMLLASPLKERFNIIHFDTSSKTSNTYRGRLDWHNVTSALIKAFRLLRLLRRERPDLAMMHLPGNRNGFIKFASLALTCSLSGSKVVARLSGGHFDRFYDQQAWCFKAIIRYTLQRTHAVTVLADCLKRTLTSIVPGEKIWTLYVYIDKELFNGISTRSKTGTDMKVLYVGHISKAKGALDLLEAIPLVLSRHPRTRFQFAGDVLIRERNITFIKNPKNIETATYELLEKEPVREVVEFLGIIKGEKKLMTYAEADIFILPSYSEGFGNVVLEAMLAGKAVVVTPVGALPEVFEHEHHLLFVEPGDVQGIAGAINRLIEDETLRIRLGQAGREFVRQRFNLEQLADRLDTVLRNVLAENGL